MAAVAAPSPIGVKAEYSDACEEVVGVHRAVGVMPLSVRHLALSGDDRVSFLHSVSSNNIQSLRPGEGCETLILTARGKIQFLLAAAVASDRIDLFVDESLTIELKNTLEAALIMEDVAVQDRSASDVFVHLAGPRLGEILGVLSLPSPAGRECSWMEHGDWGVYRRRRTVESGVDVRIPVSQAVEAFEKMCAASRALGGGPVGFVAQDILRIEAGIPKFGVDILRDQFPQEAALEEKAVSFTKGCYTGQEVVARIKTYGGVHRRSIGLIIEGPAPAPGASLYHAGEEAGRITSAARSLKLSKTVALAQARVESSQPGLALAVSSPSEARAIVVDISSPLEIGSPFDRAAGEGA